MFKQKCSFVVLFVLFFSTIFLSSTVSASTYTASLSTSGTINLNVSASGNGANVTSDSLSIISTCPSGYNVSITGPTDSTLYKNGNSSNNSATQKILASSGTRNNPLPIIGSSGATSYVKTWGYSIGDYNSSTGNYDPATVNSNFIGLTSTITNLFSSNSGTTAQGTTLPVYYGASVDSTIEPGLYTMAESSQGANDNKITYYLTTSLSCTSYTVNFSPTSTAGGQTISGTGTMNPQTISEGTPTTLTANAYTAPTGYEFKEWNTSQDGTGTSYQDTQQVTDIAQVGGSITLYAQWQKLFVCSAGKICYNDNGANSQTTMGDQTVGSSDTEATLWASNFQRAGYGFAGWNTSADGTGTQYGPNETIDDSTTLATIQSTGLKLYAKWIQSQGNIQDWQGCSSMSEGAVTALKDTRDNQVYAIAKLVDGKCWMIENLRLNTSGSNDQTKAQGFGGAFAGLANPETANFSDSTTANSLYYSGTQAGTAIIDIGTTDASNRMPRYNNQNTASPVSNMTSANSNVYSYGNYYTWPAALANTNKYRSGPIGRTDGKTSESANTSICPSGWRLPYGSSTGNGATTGGFSKLDIELGGTGASSSSSTTPTGAEMSKLWRSYPNNFIYTGDFDDSSSLNRDSYSFYWSSTSSGSSTSFYMGFGSTFVHPGTTNTYKYYGLSVRCVAGDPSYRIAFNPTSTAGGQAISGTGNMNNQTINIGVATTLNTNIFTAPSGYEFVGWNTAQDGTGTSYTDGQSVTNLTTAGQTITLYAQWRVDPCIGHGAELYCKVAAMSKGKQTLSELQTTITKPTSSNPSTDTSNSGVYEYNIPAFGVSSDASNDHTIYYYRGILDNNLDGTSSTYGSNGDGTLYPNYVKLGDTCWRIVRTTGSGGVKMIYNGLYSGGTTANSCANAQTNAQITTQAFGKQGNSAQSSDWNKNINRVGYTFNNASNIQDSTTPTSVDTVFGSNSNHSSTNTEDSNIKDYIENTWFSSANGISAYESLLEPSAGYCNDRTTFSDTTTSTSLSTIPPYATSDATMYFGAYGRNINATDADKTPSLTCPSSRNVVDLYTTPSATDGNKQLGKPVALLTADELSFAGSGRSTATQGSAYNYSSFARSGSNFWLFSPYNRTSGGYTIGFYLSSNGSLSNNYMSSTFGVRPAISLKPGITPASGTGTAVDPWVIDEPPMCNPSGTTISTISCMQDITSSNKSSVLSSMTQEQQYILKDARDGKEYYVSKLKDGNIWMTQNLDFDIGSTTKTHNSTTLYHDDTDLGYGSSSTQSWTPDKATYTNTTWADNFDGGNSNQQSYDPGNKIWNGVIDSSGNTTLSNMTQGTDMHYHIGNYYNWGAAVANNNPSTNLNDTDVDQSICPAGWRMPKAGISTSNGSFQYLIDRYGYANFEMTNPHIWDSPLYFTLSGTWDGSSSNVASVNSTWSSVASDTIYSYNFYGSDSNMVSSDNTSRRYIGNTIRCVTR